MVLSGGSYCVTPSRWVESVLEVWSCECPRGSEGVCFQCLFVRVQGGLEGHLLMLSERVCFQRFFVGGLVCLYLLMFGVLRPRFLC